MLSAALHKYKQRIADDNNNDNKTKNTTKEKEAVNIISSMNYTSIMHTNKKYNERVHKPTANCVEERFENKGALNEYIERGIEDVRRNVGWKQMPVVMKARLCETFMNQDDALTADQRSAYLDKMTTTTLFNHVKYDKKNRRITEIKYALVEPIEPVIDPYLNSIIED